MGWRCTWTPGVMVKVGHRRLSTTTRSSSRNTRHWTLKVEHSLHNRSQLPSATDRQLVVSNTDSCCILHLKYCLVPIIPSILLPVPQLCCEMYGFFLLESVCMWPRVGPGHPSFPLSIYFFIFSPFYFSLSFIGFTYFILLSTPSLSTRIVPLRFQAGGRRRWPNLGLVCFVCVICIP